MFFFTILQLVLLGALFWSFRRVMHFFCETQYKPRRSHIHAHTHPYERTHAHPTPMNTSEAGGSSLEIDEVTTGVSLSTETSSLTEKYSALNEK